MERASEKKRNRKEKKKGKKKNPLKKDLISNFHTIIKASNGIAFCSTSTCKCKSSNTTRFLKNSSTGGWPHHLLGFSKTFLIYISSHQANDRLQSLKKTINNPLLGSIRSGY